MTVYVDDMRAPYGRMVMCHMIADTDEELHAMADKIGVARRWHQTSPPASTSHYDIALSKKELAIAAGAVQITQRQSAMMAARRRSTGKLGTPDEAKPWYDAWLAAGRPKNFELPKIERPPLADMDTSDICSLMLACGMSADKSDREFARTCRDELKRRKPEDDHEDLPSYPA